MIQSYEHAPKSVVQGLWIGNRLNTMQRLSIQSFLKAGHEYDLYVYSPVSNVPSGASVRDAAEIVPTSKLFANEGYNTYASFSDLFRYNLLYSKGGWWADLDVICLRPFHFTSKYVFATQRNRFGADTIATCVIGTPIRAELMRYALASCLDAKAKDDSWGPFGPRILARAVYAFGLEKYVRPAATFCPIDFWRWGDSIVELPMERVQEESFGVHLWNEMWRRANQNPDELYSRDTLYETLKMKFLPSLAGDALPRRTPESE